jgi:hypothetical protein
MILDLAAFERRAAVERLLARAEFADLCRQKRVVQKDRVIRSRSCHTPAFIDLLLTGLRAPRSKDDAEFLSSLAVLAVQRMEEKRHPPAFKNDLLGTIWTKPEMPAVYTASGRTLTLRSNAPGATSILAPETPRSAPGGSRSPPRSRMTKAPAPTPWHRSKSAGGSMRCSATGRSSPVP